MTQALARLVNDELTPQADTDGQAIALWLHGRSCHTQRSYRATAERFLDFVQKPLRSVTLGGLHAFADSLDSLAPSSRAQSLAAVKSLFGFAYKIGYLRFNVAGALRLPKVKQLVAERILDEPDLQRMLALERNPRNRVLLRTLYAAGLRVSEVCGLKWRDLQPRTDGAGQLVAFGKGGKTRSIKLPASIWRDLMELRGDAGPSEPVFRSRKGGHLDPSRVGRIVKASAQRAGIEASVSPHWLRHAHASHALDRGAPISLVQATLGHSSVATTGQYLHARPADSSGSYLAV